VSDLSVKDYPVSAGETVRIRIPATYFQLMSSTGPVDIDFLKAETRVGRAEGVSQGFSFGPLEEPFHGVDIYSPTAQTLKVCLARGLADLKAVVGSVSITGDVTVRPKANLPVKAAITVTPVVAYVGAVNDSNRRYFFLQNKSLVGTVWFSLGWGSPLTDGVRLLPGESFEYNGVFVPYGQLLIVGDIASNPDVYAIWGSA